MRLPLAAGMLAVGCYNAAAFVLSHGSSGSGRVELSSSGGTHFVIQPGSRLRSAAGGLGWARSPIVRPAVTMLSSSSSSASGGGGEGGGERGGAGQRPPEARGATEEGAGALQEEINSIRSVRMTAGQIKAELDKLGVSYTGLLEKAEYVQALAQARISDTGAGGIGGGATSQPPEAQRAPAEAAGAPDASVSSTKKEARTRSAAEAGEAMPSADDAVAAAKARLEEDSRAAAAKAAARMKKQAEDGASAAAAAAEAGALKAKQQADVAAAAVKAEQEARVKIGLEAAAAAAEAEQAARAKQAGEATPAPAVVADVGEAEQEPEAEAEAQAAAAALSAEAEAEAEAAAAAAAAAAADMQEMEGDAKPAADTSVSGGNVEAEVTNIKQARMTAGQIKAELDGMGVSYSGLLEKAEFIRRLAEARANGAGEEPAAAAVAAAAAGGGNSDGAQEGDRQDVPTGQEEKESRSDASYPTPTSASSSSSPSPPFASSSSSSPPPAKDTHASAVDAEGPAVADVPASPTPTSSKEPTTPPANAGGAAREGVNRGKSTTGDEEVSAMRISAIKKELDERGVSYRGLLEKSEFVDLLVDARARGVTAPPPAASAGGGGGGSAWVGGNKDEFDPSYKDVEVKKMNQGPSPSSSSSSDGKPVGGSMPAGGMPKMGAGGDVDLGSILSGLGRMGGGGAGAPGGAGGAGGFDIGSILGAMGGAGMGGAAGGVPPGEGGGMGGIGEMLGKVMNNPKAMEAFQKAQNNPKVMAAIQDVTQNGMSAMSKYQDDPEILAIIEELRSVF